MGGEILLFGFVFTLISFKGQHSLFTAIHFKSVTYWKGGGNGNAKQGNVHVGKQEKRKHIMIWISFSEVGDENLREILALGLFPLNTRDRMLKT